MLRPCLGRRKDWEWLDGEAGVRHLHSQVCQWMVAVTWTDIKAHLFARGEDIAHTSQIKGPAQITPLFIIKIFLLKNHKRDSVT